MKIVGLITEYNPFHNGHAYLLDEARKQSGCDAVVCDSVIASDYVLANENYSNMLAVTGTASDTIEDIAIAVEKGNTELLDIINTSIAALMENGTMDELYAKWNLI